MSVDRAWSRKAVLKKEEKEENSCQHPVQVRTISVFAHEEIWQLSRHIFYIFQSLGVTRNRSSIISAEILVMKTAACVRLHESWIIGEKEPPSERYSECTMQLEKRALQADRRIVYKNGIFSYLH